MYPTIYEIAGGIRMPEDLLERRWAHKRSGYITDGITPVPLDLPADAATWLGPPEVASLRLAISPTGVGGAQRDPSAGAGPRKVRELALAITSGVPLPYVEVCLCDGLAFVSDGGHRCCASLMARLPIRVVTRNATPEEQKALFMLQSTARAIGRDTFVLNGTEPVDLYIHDALTREDHPWSALVAMRASRGRQGPGAAGLLAAMYGCNIITSRWSELDQSRFDASAADELADLIRAFGTAESNPLAFRLKSLRAVTMAAVHAIRRSDQRRADAERWIRHMPSFQFAAYAHIREATGLCDSLLAHWNKRLSPDRKVYR